MSAAPKEFASEEAYRHVPYDVKVEQALLGAILRDNAALEHATLAPEQFCDPLHARIFATMSQMVGAGVDVTPLTLHATMKAGPGVMDLGGQRYFDELARRRRRCPASPPSATMATSSPIWRSAVS